MLKLATLIKEKLHHNNWALISQLTIGKQKQNNRKKKYVIWMEGGGVSGYHNNKTFGEVKKLRKNSFHGCEFAYGGVE